MNFIKFPGFFRVTYVYVDKLELNKGYYIDDCVEPELLFRLKFSSEWMHPDWDFRICIVKVRKRDQEDFEKALRKLNFVLSANCKTHYIDFMKSVFSLLQTEIAKQ